MEDRLEVFPFACISVWEIVFFNTFMLAMEITDEDWDFSFLAALFTDL
jgi:hypothetical protein